MAAIPPDRFHLSTVVVPISILISALIGRKVLSFPVVGFQVQGFILPSVILAILESSLIGAPFCIRCVTRRSADVAAISIPSASGLIVAIMIAVMTIAISIVMAVLAIPSMTVAVFISPSIYA